MAIISDGTTIADAGAVNGLGSLILIKSINLGSAASNITFIHGTSSVVFDGTYDYYIFKGRNCHPEEDNRRMTVTFRDGDSNFDAPMTTLAVQALHQEGDGAASMAYWAAGDTANASGWILNDGCGNAANECMSFWIEVHAPASTTYSKFVVGRGVENTYNNIANNTYCGGYIDGAAAIDGVRFAFHSGDFDAGTISLYGVKKS